MPCSANVWSHFFIAAVGAHVTSDSCSGSHIDTSVVLISRAARQRQLIAGDIEHGVDAGLYVHDGITQF